MVAVISWLLKSFGSRRGWTVLCYHVVWPEQAIRFERQMRFLAGRAVSVDQIGTGETGVCVTFDDAFACLSDEVIPVATRFGIPIALFPVTDNLNATPRWEMPAGHPEQGLRTMSEEELMALRDHPLVKVGSHTATHPRLGEVPSDVVIRELQKSRDSLAGLLSYAPLDVALPHGSFNSQVCEVARQIGYRRIYTLEPRVNMGLPTDGCVGRFSVDPDMWMIEFRLTVAGAYGFLLPMRRAINRIRSWAADRRGRAVQSRLVQQKVVGKS